MLSEPPKADAKSASNGSSGPFQLTIDSRVVLAFILIAGAVSMYVYHMVWTGGDLSKLIHGDERRYYYPAGLAILEQGPSWFLEPRSLWTGPINPVWVALLGAQASLVKIANIGLFVGSGILVWDLARRMLGNTAGLLSAVLFVSFVPFYQFFPTLLTEPVFVFLLLGGVWLFLRASASSIWLPITAGATLGLATLTRPTLQLFPLFLVVAWLALRGALSIAGTKRHIPRPLQQLVRWVGHHLEWIRSVQLRQLGFLFLGFLIVVLPYFAKNVIANERLAFANGSGAVLYIGNDLRKGGDEPAYSDMTFDTGEITAPFKHLDTEGDQRLTSAAFERIQRDGLDVLLLQPKKAIRLILGSKDHYFWPQDNIVSFINSTTWFKQFRIWDMLLTVVSAVFGLVGLMTLRIKPTERLMFGSIIFYFMAVHTLLFPIPRLVLPMFPFLMILASGVLTLSKRSVKVTSAAIAISAVLFISFEGAFASPGVSDHYTTYFDPVVSVNPATQILQTNDVTPTGDGWYTATGGDPYLILGTPTFVGELNQQVFITLTARAVLGDDEAAVGQLFWRDSSGDFAEDSSVLFEVLADGNERIYRVSPSFTKREQWIGVLVSEFRVDLSDAEPGLQFRLADLEIRK